MIKVATIPEAWELAYKLADAGEYELDKDSEERAGYPIFREKNSYYSRICDLGCHLEIMKADGTSVNVWIEPQEPAAEEPAHYGNELAEKIKAKTEDLNHRARAVYMYLKDHADSEGKCWPGIRTISAELRMSRSTVKRALDDLCRAELISKEHRWRENGSHSSNLYRLK